MFATAVRALLIYCCPLEGPSPVPLAAVRPACCTSLLVGAVAAIASFGAIVAEPDNASAAKTKPKVALAQGLEAKIVRQVNATRRKKGLSTLRAHGRLKKSARSHSRFLARAGTASHVGSGGSKFWERIARAGYPSGRRSAETVGLAFGCHSSYAKAIVGEWMRSPQHRKALMRRGYSRIGVGVARTASCSHTAFVINVAG